MLRRSLLVLVCLITLAGCATFEDLTGTHAAEEPDPIGLLAVLPIEPDAPEGSQAEPLPDAAGKIVTAEIYAVMAESPEWRFVPDLTIADQMTTLDTLDEIATRAYKLGKAVHADSVLFGTVSRFRERVGSEYGATEPAAVEISLKLLSVSRKKIIWHGEFNQTQQSLSENLMNWWQFWRGGPRWFTAQEFTHLGVERLLEKLRKRVG